MVGAGGGATGSGQVVRRVGLEVDPVFAGEVEQAVELAGVDAFGVEIARLLRGANGLAGVADPAVELVGEGVHGLPSGAPAVG